LTRTLTLEWVERIFALGFALDQLGQNFNDLARCVAESAQTRAAGATVAAVSNPSPQ
jgi:hypothetical protein